ncbi:MAG TPA: GDSL-type esterase/lipase family protein [Chitinophagaceae bacterium]|nr:GDSL-type esterase/lipase family protein [Chitinophagaceae bacterium]
MRLLKKIAWIIALLIIVAVIKFILNRISPSSIIFSSNFLTSIQWFLFGGLICWLLLQSISRLIRKKDFPFWLSWFIFLLLMIAGEWRIYFLMQHADRVSKTTHDYLVRYYLMFERQLPEVRADCARYDPELTYTYKPGAACLQKNPEFSDSIYVNSAGLRDDEASLTKPEIICLGDSYTMGFGVEQQQVYPQLLEHTRGMKVLNAAISSYGTARETMLFKRLDTSALKYVIIQYCFNDIEENEAYLRNNYRLPVRKKAGYEQLVNAHKWATTYYPLKRVLTISRTFVRDKIYTLFGIPVPTREESYDTAYVPAAAKAFLDIAAHSTINFSKVKLLVVDINRYPAFDHHFTEVAKQILDTAQYSQEFRNSIRFVDISQLNKPVYYYPLDNHMNRAGHEQLAKLIAGQLK